MLDEMHCFRYKLNHDYGLAPNPFGGVMTLAVCKGDIRKNKNLAVGDWIIGTGSKRMKMLNQLIYAMRVDGWMSFDEYWNDSKYAFKKPVLNGSLVQMYGDNIYHTGADGIVIQEPCAHSQKDNSVNQKHLKRDVKGKNVLYSRHFFYFGCNAPKVPKELLSICCTSRNYSYKEVSEELIENFVSWLESNYTVGIHGDPCNWKEFKLPKLDIYDDGIE